MIDSAAESPVEIAEKRRLELYQESTRLPTGKHHVSFSEVKDWLECSFRHKLKHVQKIEMPESDANIYSAYGTTMHDAIETFLKTKHMPSGEETIKKFHEEINKLSPTQLERAQKMLSESPDFITSIPEILEQIPGWMNETFSPKWEIVEAEYAMFESIEKQANISFKGFLDAVIKIPREPTKKLIKEYAKEGTVPPQEYDYYILDWKTASWGWNVDKIRDFKVQLQLILYKHFFCQVMKLPMKDVKCGFALLKRVAPKERKPFDRLQLIKISVGPVALERGLKTLHGMLGQMRRGFAIKNRASCNYCVYRGTTHCP